MWLEITLALSQHWRQTEPIKQMAPDLSLACMEGCKHKASVNDPTRYSQRGTQKKNCESQWAEQRKHTSGRLKKDFWQIKTNGMTLFETLLYCDILLSHFLQQLNEQSNLRSGNVMSAPSATYHQDITSTGKLSKLNKIIPATHRKTGSVLVMCTKQVWNSPQSPPGGTAACLWGHHWGSVSSSAPTHFHSPVARSPLVSPGEHRSSTVWAGHIMHVMQLIHIPRHSLQKEIDLAHEFFLENTSAFFTFIS